MSFLFGVVLILSIISLIYYVIITMYAGLGASFSSFWLVNGLIGLAVSNGIYYMILQDIYLILMIRVLIIVFVSVVVLIFAIIEGMLLYHSKSEGNHGLDYIIVLGAQVKGTIICKALKRRLDTSIQYLKENPETQVIVSGGQGAKELITEAQAMHQYLIVCGISKKRIIKEDRSRNTFENILYSKTFLKPNASVGIVSNGFHIFRAVSVAKKLGLVKAQGIAAPTDRILALNYYVREAIGVLKDKLIGNM